MQWLIIGISGITCGGKTTLAHHLHEYFLSQHNQQLFETTYNINEVHMISQDDYFLPVYDKRHQIVKRINAINYELLTSLDMEKMILDIAWTLKGLSTITTTTTTTNNNNLEQRKSAHQQQQQQQKIKQKYMTNKHKQKQQQQQQMQLRQEKEIQKSYMLQQIQRKMLSKYVENHLFMLRNSNSPHFDASKVNILIIEGFTIFNHNTILNLCNIKFHFHLPYEKCYERRLKRTYDPPDVVGYFELCVWPHYDQSLNEYKHCKDIIFLNGEIERERIFKFVVQKLANYFGENFIAIDNSYWENVVKSDTKKLCAVNMRLQHHNNNNNNEQLQQQQPTQQQPAHFTIINKMQH